MADSGGSPAGCWKLAGGNTPGGAATHQSAPAGAVERTPAQEHSRAPPERGMVWRIVPGGVTPR